VEIVGPKLIPFIVILEVPSVLIAPLPIMLLITGTP